MTAKDIAAIIRKHHRSYKRFKPGSNAPYMQHDGDLAAAAAILSELAKEPKQELSREAKFLIANNFGTTSHRDPNDKNAHMIGFVINPDLFMRENIMPTGALLDIKKFCEKA